MRKPPKAANTAADIVNTEEESVLADIIYHFGEERHSRRIARAIAAQRLDTLIDTTGRLADIVARAIPPSRARIHPATRTFQALRIYVNEELGDEGELENGLAVAEKMLVPGGRLAVVSFHSLEDRVVKSFLRGRSAQTNRNTNRHLPEIEDSALATLVPARLRKPSEEEVAQNPRSRSARLRTAVRLQGEIIQ